MSRYNCAERRSEEQERQEWSRLLLAVVAIGVGATTVAVVAVVDGTSGRHLSVRE